MTQKYPQAAFIIIGNEILDGSTQEANLQCLVELLRPKGISVAEVRVVRDEEAQIITALEQTTKIYDYVFTSGGIGPTHDDITAVTVAKFYARDLQLNQQVLDELTSRYPDPSHVNDAVKKMAYIPEGAELIRNSISSAPGFQLENTYVLAGVPPIFRSMLESVCASLPSSPVRHSGGIIVHVGESRIAAILDELVAEYPQLEIGSYPRKKDDTYFVKLLLRSYDADLIKKGLSSLQQKLDAHSISHSPDK